MENKVNIQRIVESWAPAVEQLSKGVVSKDSNKMEWVCQLAHNQKMHAIYENAEMSAVGGVTSPISTLNNIVGVGNAQPAQMAAMTAADQTNYANHGSGDKWPVFLPMAVQVAARTIGFDLVNVTPMDGPTGVIPFMDYVYSDGKAPYGATPGYNYSSEEKSIMPGNPRTAWSGSRSQNGKDPSTGLVNPAYKTFGNPAAFKAQIVPDASAMSKKEIAKALRAAGTFTIGEDLVIEFIAMSRLSADPMFKVCNYGSQSITDIFEAAGEEGVALGETGVYVRFPRLISMLEDQILGYAGAGKYDSDKWDGTFRNPRHIYEPMDRATGETQYPRHLSLTVHTQFVQVGKIQVAVAVTREQVQDLQKQFGIDVLKMVENAAINELSQHINKHILDRLFALGWLNHCKAYDAEGVLMNVSFNGEEEGREVEFATVEAGEEVLRTLPVPAMTYYGEFENQDTKNARIARMVKTAGNIIMQRGRRGPANFCVTNYKIASMLQDQAQYTFAPLANTFNQNNGQLYPLGTVAGITVYVDPYMAAWDTRVLVGRKGEKDEPGVHFCPYLMAESVNFIDKDTFAPKVVVSSRYALVNVGWYPETQYFTFFVDTPENLY